MFLLDTNVLSELIIRAPDPTVQLWINRHGAVAAVPAVAVFELRVGAVRLPDGTRRDQLGQAIDRIVNRFVPRVYSFDRAAAEAGAELIGLAQRQGRILERRDAQIAGIAAVYGLTLVTRNPRDFAGLDLDLVDPWTAG